MIGTGLATSSGWAKPERERRRVLSPSPAPLLSLADLGCSRDLGSLAPPFHRDHRPPLPPSLPTSEPVLQVENLGRADQPGPQQRLRRQQRDMVAGGTLYFSPSRPRRSAR